ncbi:hypothetical protein ACHAWF_001347 [Thalassiosira exigua]
MTLKEFRSSC